VKFENSALERRIILDMDNRIGLLDLR